MNIITKSLFIFYLIITRHLLYANIHIAKANTYLEWVGTASYPSQNLAIPFLWVMPPPKLLSINMTCDNTFINIEPDKEILDKHMKDIDIGLEVNILDQLCSVNSNFCVNRTQEKENRPRIIFEVAAAIVTTLAIVETVAVNGFMYETEMHDQRDSQLYQEKMKSNLLEIENISVKVEALEKNVEKLKENLCGINRNVTSGNLANQYLSVYWNRYKSVLDSAIRGEVNHQLLNLGELGKLIANKGLKYKYSELDMFSMFRASKFVLVKHNPATPSIYGILMVPIILKTETLPVYRPLTLTIANTRYYKFPNEIAISYIRNHYHVYQLEDCEMLNGQYVCPINAVKTSDKTREIEDFMNDIDKSITSDVAGYNQDSIEGMNGVYIRKGQEYSLVKLSENINENFKTNENSFINYDEFDVLILGEKKIIGSNEINQSLNDGNKNDLVVQTYNQLRHAKELLLKNNILTDEKVEQSPSGDIVWTYAVNTIDTYKYVSIAGYVSILIPLFWVIYIEYRIRIKRY